MTTLYLLHTDRRWDAIPLRCRDEAEEIVADYVEAEGLTRQWWRIDNGCERLYEVQE